MLETITITLVGAVFGAIISYYIPFFVERNRTKSRGDLVGDWLSTYQAYHTKETSQSWIPEKVSIEIRGSVFIITSTQNALGDYWAATGKMRSGEMVGSWNYTISSGAHGSGSFVLTIAPTGDFMYGIFSGPRRSGERVYGSWLMGKNRKALEAGRSLLSSQLIELPKIGAGT